MSLGGIAIAIGVMVDSSIVMVENAHKHLDREEDRLRLTADGTSAHPVPRPRREIIADAAKEVGPSLFFALAIIVVSFLPIFVLSHEAGRMFRPLAFTKTFAMASSAILAVTVIPVLMSLLITSRVLPKKWGWASNLALTLGAMFAPAALIYVLPLEALAPWRGWIALGWIVLMGMLLVPQKIIHENSNPISRLQQWIYQPFFTLAMRFKFLMIGLALAALALTLVPLLGAKTVLGESYVARDPWLGEKFPGLGVEFLPPLEEGDLLYMPTTDPGVGPTKARELLQQTDRLIAQFPEVQSVAGKAGRADTATDPAPMSMIETTIMLHRDKSRWRQVPVDRFYRNWPQWGSAAARLWPDHRPITQDELLHGYDLPGTRDPATGRPIRVPGMDDVLHIPGLTNSWTMPIETRRLMNATGMKSRIGVKIVGPDLGELDRLAGAVAQLLKTDPALSPYTRSAFAEKTQGGAYLDITIDRDNIARYGLSVQDVQDVIGSAMGGLTATTTVEGLQRYSVNLRYGPELRQSLPLSRDHMQDLSPLKQTLVATRSGVQVPLGQLARFDVRSGPDMIRSENARPAAWVYVDMAGTDMVSYVNAARRQSGQDRSRGRLQHLLVGRVRVLRILSQHAHRRRPGALVLIVLLLYLASRSWTRVLIILLAVPFSLIGAVWLVYLLGYNISTAVIVGAIALAGLDAETGMVMLLYLDNSFERFRSGNRMRDRHDLWLRHSRRRRQANSSQDHDRRHRPRRPAAAAVGLGRGADTMRRLAAPMIGGLASSFIMELLIYPVLFYLAKLRDATGSGLITKTTKITKATKNNEKRRISR